MMYRFLFLLVLMLLVACGADEEAAFEVSDKVPVISVKKGSIEIDRGIVNATYSIVADTAPKTDLLVSIQTFNSGAFRSGSGGDPGYSCDGHAEYYWVTIPEGKKESQEIKIPGRIQSVNGAITVLIEPLPIVSIVGQGDVIDQDTLREWYGGDFTKDDKRIPDNHTFAYYEPADDESVYLYYPKKAKIVDIQPPDGSFLLDSEREFVVTFDVPPYCPKASTFSRGDITSVSANGDGTVFTIRFRIFFLDFGKQVTRDVTLDWGLEEFDTDVSQKLQYKIFRPLSRPR